MEACERMIWMPYDDGSLDPVMADECDYGMDYVWMDTPCEVQAQVDADGMVSIVHGGPRDMSGGTASKDYSHATFAVDNMNVFRPDWRGGVWPHAESGCNGSADCEVHGSTCLCNTTVITDAVYTTTDGLDQPERMLSQLHVGAVSPDTFDAGTYTLDASRSTAAVEVWLPTAGGSSTVSTLSADAIFKITVPGKRPVWRTNLETVVTLGGSVGFRVPPHFVQVHDPTVAQAEQETEAMIDHIFTHPNTAPYISQSLIQRFTSSNPSPRYVK